MSVITQWGKVGSKFYPFTAHISLRVSNLSTFFFVLRVLYAAHPRVVILFTSFHTLENRGFRVSKIVVVNLAKNIVVGAFSFFSGL